MPSTEIRDTGVERKHALINFRFARPGHDVGSKLACPRCKAACNEATSSASISKSPAKKPSFFRMPFSVVRTDVRASSVAPICTAATPSHATSARAKPWGSFGSVSIRSATIDAPSPRPLRAIMTPPPRMKLPSFGMMRWDHGVGALRRAR
ncbi:hypothetical protein [Bradyrhizobium sp. USDA 3650]